MPDDPDRMPLGDGDWLLWRHFVLRGTGFAFASLTDALADPDAAEPNDLDWAASVARTMARALDLSVTEPVRTAMLWQNPQVVELSLDWLRSSVDKASHRNVRRRASEHTVVKYLQRYHARNESVGFFGPVVWGTVDSRPGRLAVVPGPALAHRPRAYLEDWAVDAVGRAFADDPEIAVQLPVALAFGVARAGRALTRPDGGLHRLTAAQAELVRLVDGVRTVRDIAATAGVTPAEAEDILSGLIAEGLLSRAFDIPPQLTADGSLAAQLAALEPGPAVRRATAALAELSAAREDSAAADSADALAAALGKLDDRFASVTGAAASRKRGDAAFGRRILVTQAERDLRLTLGADLVEELAAPLSLVLTGARWLARRAGEEFEALASTVYIRLAPMFGPDAVPLNALCAQLLPLTQRPDWLDPLVADLTRRWVGVLAPDDGAGAVTRTAAALADPVRHTFGGPAPGFHAGRHHSPDVMIAAADATAIEAGEYEFVLGEVHVAMVTVDGQSFMDFAPAPDLVPRLIDLARPDGRPTFVPLHARRASTPTSGWDHPPPDAHWPAYTYLSFGERIGERAVPPAQRVSAATVTVGTDNGRLVARLPDGPRWPLLDVLGQYVAYALANRFRMLPPRPHTPRVTIDRLVVARETWRLPYGQLGPVARLPEPEAYRRLRRVAAEHGIRRHTYWRSAPGVKPIYLDLHSPLLVAVLLREVRRVDGLSDEVAFTEMHPGPDDLWLPDARDRRYTSELRLTVADTAPPERQ